MINCTEARLSRFMFSQQWRSKTEIHLLWGLEKVRDIHMHACTYVRMHMHAYCTGAHLRTPYQRPTRNSDPMIPSNRSSWLKSWPQQRTWAPQTNRRRVVAWNSWPRRTIKTAPSGAPWSWKALLPKDMTFQWRSRMEREILSVGELWFMVIHSYKSTIIARQWW